MCMGIDITIDLLFDTHSVSLRSEVLVKFDDCSGTFRKRTGIQYNILIPRFYFILQKGESNKRRQKDSSLLRVDVTVGFL